MSAPTAHIIAHSVQRRKATTATSPFARPAVSSQCPFTRRPCAVDNRSARIHASGSCCSVCGPLELVPPAVWRLLLLLRAPPVLPLHPTWSTPATCAATAPSRTWRTGAPPATRGVRCRCAPAFPCPAKNLDPHALPFPPPALCGPCHTLAQRGVSGRAAASAASGWHDGGPCGVCGSTHSALWRRGGSRETPWVCQACVVLGDAGDDTYVVEDHDARRHTLQRVAVPPSSAAEALVRTHFCELPLRLCGRTH